jgi:cyclopropane-fatty-acyl-phospholipid synthase
MDAVRLSSDGSPTSSCSPPAPRPGPLSRLALARVTVLLRGVPIRLELWDGSSATPSNLPPVATVAIGDMATLLDLVRRGDLAFGEAYVAGRIEVRGDLVRLFEVVNRARADRMPPVIWRELQRLVTGASARSARENVHRHYNLGNDFYRLWLDDEMIYTCAYFAQPDVSLEEAQRAKLDYVCRKLELRPGERVIEAGCGWGALALHMARYYGVSVRAYNISEPQLAHARERAWREGLAGHVTFVDGDYRSIDGQCDAFVSVGMLEHVGWRQYRALGAVIDRVLDPVHGRGLLHFIGRDQPQPFNRWTERHVFPGAYAPALSEVTTRVFEPRRLSVLDVENLRLHYAKTLEHWRARFEREVRRVRDMFDERFVRTWRMYLATAEAGFTTGELQLFQVTFSRVSNNAVPWTRAPLYENFRDESLPAPSGEENPRGSV